jgi:hypothetical protein
MKVAWDMSFKICEPASSIVEDASLVDYVEDWSKVRSPSRARRRIKRGIRKSLPMKAIPSKTVYSIDNSRMLVMHPEVARAMERHIAAQIDHSIESVIMTGRL